MRQPLVCCALLLCTCLAVADDKPATTQPADAVPVKAVALFSSGVGYFEHYGTVKGSGSTELRFKSQQINDILKSLVLQDLDGGKVTTISYPSVDPINKTLKSFQVDITTNPGLGELLNQLRGAKVKVETVDAKREGTILGLEKKRHPASEKDKEAVDYWVMNLTTNGHIKSVDLDSVTDLQLEDPRLQEELDKALAALAQARDQDKKPVTIHFAGEGDRRVRIGYVVETPIWKTSYRLILDNKKKDSLQGWAIVENQTDNDWNDVQLSLVSGRPISFIQDLSQPLYVPRPLVKPELFVSLQPQTYEAGVDAQKNAERFDRAQQQVQQQVQQAQQMAQNGRGRNGGLGQNLFQNGANGQNQGGDQPLDPTASVASIASASKIGELFQYTVGSVTLPRQKSAMIPIITDPVEVERLSIYNQATLESHPLYGARVKNTTGKHLLAGPVTVLDGASYAGDARIDDVPPGQERFVSYGIDLQVTMDASKEDVQSQVQTASILRGLLKVTTKSVRTHEYTAENKGDKDRTLIIEHAYNEGWSLVDTEKPIEKTDSVYRFKGKVPAGKASKLVVKEQVVEGSEFAILKLDDQQLDVNVKNAELPQKVRDVLADVAKRRAAIAESDRRLQDTQKQIADISTEQQRIRENLKTVTQTSDYSARLLTKLNDQETQIEKLQSESKEIKKDLEKQRKDLDDFLQHTDISA